MSYNQIAVFYRTNAQSRMLEDMLLRAGVPYRIVGGTKFFDRAEIRDVMAYLTLVVNPADDIAAKRVINVPRRGIGKTTIERIEQFAREMGMTFMQGAELVVLDPELRASTRRAVGEFVELIKEAQEYSGELRRVVEMIVDRAGLISALTNENTDEARGRIENIQEFMGVVDEFSQTHEEGDAEFAAPTEGDAVAGDAEPARVLRGDSLADFIEWVRLRTDLDTMGEDGKAVTLMTVHSSKGLEFDCVFTAGMEETLFPHMNSVERCCGNRGGAQACLRCDHPCAKGALSHVRAAAPDLRPDVGEPGIALHPRDSCRAASNLGAGLCGLFRHWLGETRKPSRYRGKRYGSGRRSRVRALERIGKCGPR